MGPLCVRDLEKPQEQLKRSRDLQRESAGSSESNCFKLLAVSFVIEARREDGEPYPGSTIVNMLSRLYCYSRQCGADCPNFVNRKDLQLWYHANSLTVRCRDVQQSGIGTVRKHTPVVTQDENLFWESKVMRENLPVSLQREVFFYVGKTFCLHKEKSSAGWNCQEWL